MSAQDWPVPIAGEQFTTVAGSRSARRTTARSSAASPSAVRRRSTRGRVRDGARVGGPLAPWQRAEILDTAARLLAIASRSSHGSSPAKRPSRSRRRGSRRSARSRRSPSPPSRRARSPARSSRWTRPRPAKESSAFTLRLPIGVVGAISPFNFPLNLVAHKLAPAIAAGCPVVLKPASQTPLSAIALAELLLDEVGPRWSGPPRRGGRARSTRAARGRLRADREEAQVVVVVAAARPA